MNPKIGSIIAFLVAVAGVLFLFYKNYMQLKKSIETYLQWKEAYTNIARSRYENYLLNFMKYFGEETLLENITGDDIAKYFTFLKTQITQYNTPYSLTTIAYIMVIFKNYFRFWSISFNEKTLK